MYRNWEKDKPIPNGMVVYKKKWVIPADLEVFMPPAEILNMPGCTMIYTVDGASYDLYEHEWFFEED